MIRPCSGRGRPPSAAARSDSASRSAGCAGAPRRNVAALAVGEGSSTNLRASPIHGASRIGPRTQEEKPGRARRGGCGLQASSERAFHHAEFAAGDIGDGGGIVAGAAIGDDDFGDESLHRRRHQRRQRRHQSPFRIAGWDDDAQHPWPTALLLVPSGFPDLALRACSRFSNLTKDCSCFVHVCGVTFKP